MVSATTWPLTNRSNAIDIGALKHMAKWADYLISAIRLNSARTHIAELRVHEDHDTSVGAGGTWTRLQVITQIERLVKSFKTIYEDAGGNWRRGEDVHVVHVGGQKYLRTDPDETPLDNLGELPEF